MDQTDFDLQEKLVMEFEMFADIMQVPLTVNINATATFVLKGHYKLCAC
jgi:hypothetical protein